MDTQSQEKSFDHFGDLLKGASFDQVSVLQEKIMLSIQNGQSDTGKTTALAFAILQLIDPQVQPCQALILAPNRDTVNNIQKLIASLGEYLKVNVCASIRGINQDDLIKKLQENPQIVIGTPGKITQDISDGFLKVENLKIIVLEKADEIFCMGFEPEIKEIYKVIPENVQSVLSSVTMPPRLLAFTEEFMKDAEVIIADEKDKLLLNEIKQLRISNDKDE